MSRFWGLMVLVAIAAALVAILRDDPIGAILCVCAGVVMIRIADVEIEL